MLLDDCYAAGLFDADGCVRINRWQKPNSTHIRFNVIATVANCCLPVIEAMRETYGGSIHKTQIRPAKETHRLQYAWHAGSQVACAFLVRVKPHLIVKADEAELALALQDHINSTSYRRPGRPKAGEASRPRTDSSEINAFREDLYHKIAALKKRSYPPLLSDGPSEISE